MTGRKQWLAMLAKLTSPMESTTAAQGFAAFLPMLADYPDAAFTSASLDYVASECRGGVPNYGDVRQHLGAWWKRNRPEVPELAAPPKSDYPGPRSELERNHATAVVREAVAELRMRGIERQARTDSAQPVWLRPPTQMTREQLTEAYRLAGVKGPAIPTTPTPLRAAAADIRTETRKGSVIP